jgi:hypothetical protein
LMRPVTSQNIKARVSTALSVCLEWG